MASVQSDGRRDRDEHGVDGAAGQGGFYPQLLAALSTSCRGRMFVGFDVTARREEQPGVHVVDEQDGVVVAIEKDGIRHEMPIRGGRLCSSKDVVRGLEPAQRVGDVRRLKGI